ncbi:Asp23/Gls24 family envelope stress response protein [Streptococcus pantholopis]|uniref:Stress response regulator gls24 homolog n=1 Tax=Streptococcus pantholopis TaxID=1811193 RepID=A0A172Q586_9STRE|nr:Asp23/Gls24 family envelope stress response protein [Streptococcus pantholopis]AND78614.1 stress response regulator Gls24 [Streptococcus pantholopis]
MAGIKSEMAIKGELTYADKVIEKIVGLALETVDGLLAADGGFLANVKDKLINTDTVTDGIHVEIGRKQVAVDLSVVVQYQKHVPTVFENIKAVIAEEIKRMTGLEVVEVNVSVADIKTYQQYENDKVSLQDRLADAAQTTGDFASKQYTKLAKEAESVSDGPRVR